MAKAIMINNYFFDNVTSYTPKYQQQGSSDRMPHGTFKTEYNGDFYTFTMKLEGVTPTQLGQLMYLDNLCKPSSGSSANLEFRDDTDGSALDVTFPLDVTIPINGFDFDREDGEEESYMVDLTLEEV